MFHVERGVGRGPKVGVFHVEQIQPEGPFGRYCSTWNGLGVGKVALSSGQAAVVLPKLRETFRGFRVSFFASPAGFWKLSCERSSFSQSSRRGSGVAGAEAPSVFLRMFGPAEAVPLLQSAIRDPFRPLKAAAS